MASKKTHPSVQQFKEFVKLHPMLVQEVRKDNKSWQEVFEDWYLLGENDAVWKQYKGTLDEEEEVTEKEKVDFMAQMISGIKNMDVNTVNHHISNLSSTISTIQGLFDQFGVSKGSSQSSSNSNQQPFSFRKD